MSEFTVHRLRFGNWLPSAIKSIAVDRKYSNKAAIGREDGEIEIICPNDGYATQARVSGVSDFKLQSLVWSQFHSIAEHPEEEAGRLFGISLKGFLFEMDLTTCTLINIQDTFGGAAWSLAASPRSNLLAVGGEDGSVRLFRYYEFNKLDYVRSLPTAGSRVLSLAFHPSRNHLYIGCSDGTIRCIDEDSGRVMFRMTGDVHPGVFTPSMWSLAVLSDSTVITGDSRGQVQIWDGNVGVLQATFLQHAADVLTVVTSPDEHSVFASGIDGKVICIQRSGNDEINRHHWVYTHSHRTHTHDVFSLAIAAKSKKYSTYPGKAWTLLSGGLDTRLSMYSVDDFDRVRPVWMPIIPANELISHSANQERVVLRHKQHLDIWNMQYEAAKCANEETASSSSALVGKGLDNYCTLILRLKAAGSDHISCASLSPNGNLLIMSTNAETKAWRILYQPSNPSNGVKLVKLKLPELFAGRKGFLRHIVFNREGNLFAAWHSTKKSILLFSSSVSDNDDENPDAIKLLASISYEPTTSEDSNVVDSKLSHVVRRVAFSHDSKYLAISNASKEVTLFNIKKRSKHWTIPELPATIADIQFLTPEKKNQQHLVILLANNSIVIFECDKMELHPWSAENESLKRKSIPHELRFPLAGIAVDPKLSNRFFVYGQLQSVHIDLSKEMPSHPKVIAPSYAIASQQCDDDDAEKHVSFSSETKGTKRKRGESIDSEDEEHHISQTKQAKSNSPNFALVETYRNILHLGLSLDNSMVVIENPWARITEALPDTIGRKRYGT